MTSTNVDLTSLFNYMNENPESEVVQYLIYANPKHQGFVKNNKPTERAMNTQRRIEYMLSGKEYPYGDTEVTSVSAKKRVEHTIGQYLDALNVVHKIELDFKINGGKKGPVKNIGGNEVNQTFINKLGSQIRKALKTELPTLIELLYDTTKHKTLTYSTNETNLYRIQPSFLMAAINYIQQNLSQIDLSNRSDFEKNWLTVSDKGRGKKNSSSKLPPKTQKLIDAVSGRIGKLLYSGEPKTQQEFDHIESAKVLVSQQFFDFRADYSSDDKLKKSVYQNKLKKHLEAGFYLNKIAVLNMLSANVETIGMEKAVLFLDIYDEQTRSLTTLQLFDAFTYIASNGGVCNERLFNAIIKFMSTFSLDSNGAASRKFIPVEIELTIVQSAKLDSIKIGSKKPLIIFSESALQNMNSNSQKKFRGLHDPEGFTGFLQTGKMSLVSSLKTSNPKESVVPAQGTDDYFKHIANFIAEFADLYAATQKGRKDELEKVRNAAKAGSPVVSPAFVQRSHSPVVERSNSPIPRPVEAAFEQLEAAMGAAEQKSGSAAASPAMQRGSSMFAEQNSQRHNQQGWRSPPRNASPVGNTSPLNAQRANSFNGNRSPVQVPLRNASVDSPNRAANTSSIFGNASRAAPFGTPPQTASPFSTTQTANGGLFQSPDINPNEFLRINNSSSVGNPFAPNPRT